MDLDWPQKPDTRLAGETTPSDFSDDETICPRATVLIKNAFSHVLAQGYGCENDADFNNLLFSAYMNIKANEDGIPISLSIHALILDEEGQLHRYPQLMPGIQRLFTDIVKCDMAGIDVSGNTIEFGDPHYLIHLLREVASRLKCRTLDDSSLDLEKGDFYCNRDLFNHYSMHGRMYRESVSDNALAQEAIISTLPGRFYTGRDHMDFVLIDHSPDNKTIHMSLEEIATALHQECGGVKDPYYNQLCIMN